MTNLSIEKVKKLIPSYVFDIAEKLGEIGFEAYLVGGSIRDILLGKSPDDFDIATDAMPEEIMNIFPRSVPTGAKFGTITVVGEDEQGERFDVEVTTYRSEEDYVGGRWPTKVEFTKTIEEDLARRDFTINAIALEVNKLKDATNSGAGIQDVLKDPYGGIDSLSKKIIRAVGDPIERFSEDGLRSVRACRLASGLGFKIEEKTFDSIKQTLHITKQIAVERFRDELIKTLMRSSKPSVGLRLMKQSGILELFIPELLEGVDVVQPEFHVEDVFDHSLKSCDVAEDSIKLAALFHDIGKPRTRSEDETGIHFYGHDMEGEKMTREIMKRLKFPNREIDRTARLVRWHMFYYPSADWRKLGKVEELANEDKNTEKTAHGWTDSAIRRLIQNVGGEEAIDDLMKLRIADATANPKDTFNPIEIDVLSRRIADVRAKDMALKITDLDITGRDLIENFDVEAGPKVGEILAHLLDQVIEEPLYNKKVDLLRLAKEYLDNE